MAKARAYVYSGDWVADCTRPGCEGTEFLHELRIRDQAPGGGNPRDVRKDLFVCSNCRQFAEIEWPSQEDMRGIMLVLSSRPIPSTRNWYPQDHATAVKLRLEHGQSVDDLRAENREHGVPV